jgi:hypothetical protein
VQIAVGVRRGDVLHDAALLFALGRIALEIRVQHLDEPPVDGAQAVLLQLLMAAGALLCRMCRFLASRARFRGTAALLSAAKIVRQLSGRGRGFLFGHVRAQLRHFNIESELVEDGGHFGLGMLNLVLHRLRIADVM